MTSPHVHDWYDVTPLGGPERELCKCGARRSRPLLNSGSLAQAKSANTGVWTVEREGAGDHEHDWRPSEALGRLPGELVCQACGDIQAVVTADQFNAAAESARAWVESTARALSAVGEEMQRAASALLSLGPHLEKALQALPADERDRLMGVRRP
jgi:hypothetical protein